MLWLRTGNPAVPPRSEEPGYSVVRAIIETSYPTGLTLKNTELAFRPGTLESMLRTEAGRQFAVLSVCRNVRMPSGESVAVAVRRETERGTRLVLNALNRIFSRERIRRLLEKNPELIRLQK